MIRFTITYIIISLLALSGLSAQGFYTDFGKTRVQYQEFNWTFSRSENFDIYYYQGGRDLAQYVYKQAPGHIESIENLIDYKLTDKINYLVYNQPSEKRQSNIGSEDLEAGGNTGGVTPYVGNEIAVYFNGNLQDFDREIRRATARMIIQEMLYGGSIQERMQNAALMNVPEWYIDGLVNYIAEDWNPELNDRLREAIKSGDFRRFRRISEEDRLLAGHSLWKYIGQQYGKPAISNIIYMTRVNKSIESGFMFVLGKSYNEVFEEWFLYYESKFAESEHSYNEPDELINPGWRIRRHKMITQAKLSPTANYTAIVTNDIGRITVWIYDNENESRSRVLRYGYRTNEFKPDYTNPVIGWHPVHNQLTVFYEHKGRTRYFIYDADKDKKEDEVILFRVDRVLSFDYHRNGRTVVMSAINSGKSNIYTLDIVSTSVRPITNDIYTDLDPVFVRNSDAILFSSNRKHTSIEAASTVADADFNNSLDIFYYDMYNRPANLIRVTDYPEIDAVKPTEYNDTYFGYLVPDNGVYGRNAAFLDSVFVHIKVTLTYELADTIFNTDTLYFEINDTAAINIPEYKLNDTLLSEIDTAFIYRHIVHTYALTNYESSILDYQVNKRTRQVLELKIHEQRPQIFLSSIDLDKITANAKVRAVEAVNMETMGIGEQPVLSSLSVKYQDIKEGRKDDDSEGMINDEESGIEVKDTARYFFQSDFMIIDEEDETDRLEVKEYYREQIRELAKQEEQHRVEDRERTLRLPASRPYFTLFTPDYFVTQFDNSIINTPYQPYRPGEAFISSQPLTGMFKLGMSDRFKDYHLVGGFRIATDLSGADYFLTYENRRRRLNQTTTFYRQSRMQDDVFTAERTSSHELRYGVRWPFDETRSLRGSAFYRIDRTVFLSTEQRRLERPDELANWGGLKVEYVFDNTIRRGKNLFQGTRYKVFAETFRQLDGEESLFVVLGFDVRNYIKVHRQIIWANRLSYNTSVGQAHVVYFLGGVDNWLIPQFEEDIQVDPEMNYVYKSLASNMRGFQQNIRNGNSYAVFNSELRIPVFRYLLNRPLRSDFFENFQIVGFGDAGAAWTGTTPFSEDNAFNRRVIETGPIRMSVINIRSPLVFGYGVGLRSTILGYFVRFDYAWGVEGREEPDNMIYLSLGLDF